jgi:DNA-directed RNA polymerase subunit RPC12/RpoP
MDGANKAMKAIPYTYKVADWQYDRQQGKRVKVGDIEKTVEAMTMFDVNKTVMRCLVKNLAMFGLGLYIYAGEDLPQDIREYVCADCGKAVDSAMAQRTHKAFGAYLCKECGLERSKKKEEAKNDDK